MIGHSSGGVFRLNARIQDGALGPWVLIEVKINRRVFEINALVDSGAVTTILPYRLIMLKSYLDTSDKMVADRGVGVGGSQDIHSIRNRCRL